MTVTEAVNTIKDWPNTPAPVMQNGDAVTAKEKLAFVKSLWT